MIHKRNNKKLSLTCTHRKSLIRNMCKSLISHEQIKTTLAKAKTLRRIAEKLVTIGKKNSLCSRRKLSSKLGSNSEEVNKILLTLSPRYKERKGGYTRIIKAGYRKGDCAAMAIIQFIT